MRQNSSIISTIDQIVEHHYFNTKLEELLQNRHTGGGSGLVDDQYYTSEN